MSEISFKRAYWCDDCQVPVLGETCLACGRKAHSISSARLVPVFRPEINYLKKQNGTCTGSIASLRELETWVAPANHTYYSGGIAVFKMSLAEAAVATSKEYKSIKLPRRSQEEILFKIKSANRGYIEALQYEAENFVRDTTDKYSGRPVLISFSGGKDSTVVSHLVMTALGRSDVLHIFADTTIELPDTYRYIKEFQRKHPLTPFVINRSPLDFFDTAKKIGPPSRILRWCCSTHKTTPLAKLISGISPSYGVLTFDGIRSLESARRAKYPRISNQHKIEREILARPILNWTDFQVWMYLLYHGLSFNYAYRKGFRRVGCLHCPLNSNWSQRIIDNRYPQHARRWNHFLMQQAKLMKRPNPDAFVSNGWRVRAGGRGLDHYKTSIESVPCVLADTAFSYQILSGDIHQVREFLRPLGTQTQISGNGYSESFIIRDYNSNELLATVEIGFEDEAIRVNYLVEKYRRLLQQRTEKQLRKLQSCIFCGACSARCPVGALEVGDIFCIDESKCVGCLACVQHQCPAVKSLHYIPGGI